MNHSIYLVHNKNEERTLRKKLSPLTLTKEEFKALRALAKEMRVIMKEANGVGLSANQIGIEKRFFVAQVPDAEGRPKFYAIANPELLKKGIETAVMEEGCLSIPERYGLVERADRVTLAGYDLRGKKVKINAWGFLARVFQHEVDHLDGKVFTDHAKHVYRAGEGR
ncbi:MAG: peptide deformylase [Candidatus Brennerbacteria bacterium]|nr:peptide deformylase [Candidatus Brennerbacteria bacterium]